MNDPRFKFRPSLNAVTALLDGASLPSSDLDDALLEHFIAAWSGDELVGVVGVEPFGGDGLLRSLAIRDSARGAGLGRALVSAAENHAASLGIASLYLLTNTAAPYFLRLGYRDCPRTSAAESIRNSNEFSSLCPDNAAFMCKRFRVA
jgi:amino-acid N-acetyltransferase